MTFPRNTETPHSFKKCKFLTCTFKDAFSSCHSHQKGSSDPSKKRKCLMFSNCHAFRGRISSSSSSSLRRDHSNSDFDEQEVSSNTNRYMKSKDEQNCGIAVNGFYRSPTSTTGDLPITLKAMLPKAKGGGDDEGEDFFTPRSHLSRCSSASGTEALGSAKLSFPRRSSSSSRLLEFQELWRRHLIIQELHQHSWSWHKSARMMKLHLKS